MSDQASTDIMMDPVHRGGESMMARLWRHRELVFTLVKRDLKIRYKASALGFLWSFGKPLLLMLVIWSVFSMMVRVPSSHPLLPYPLHLLTGLLPWMFLQGALSESLYSVLNNSSVVKKVWLPAEVFPTATVLGQLVHFGLAMMVLAVFIAGYAIFGRVPEIDPWTQLPLANAGDSLGVLVLPSWEILLLPLLVLLQLLFAFGVALILSSLYVFYRDVASITEIVLSAWFYLTPVIYPGNFAREALQSKGLDFLYWLWLCNPMTPLTLAYRRCIYGNMFQGDAREVNLSTLLQGLGVSAIATAVVLTIGIVTFRRLSRRFADEL